MRRVPDSNASFEDLAQTNETHMQAVELAHKRLH